MRLIQFFLIGVEYPLKINECQSFILTNEIAKKIYGKGHSFLDCNKNNNSCSTTLRTPSVRHQRMTTAYTVVYFWVFIGPMSSQNAGLFHNFSHSNENQLES